MAVVVNYAELGSEPTVTYVSSRPSDSFPYPPDVPGRGHVQLNTYVDTPKGVILRSSVAFMPGHDDLSAAIEQVDKARLRFNRHAMNELEESDRRSNARAEAWVRERMKYHAERLKRRKEMERLLMYRFRPPPGFRVEVVTDSARTMATVTISGTIPYTRAGGLRVLINDQTLFHVNAYRGTTSYVITAPGQRVRVLVNDYEVHNSVPL